MIALCPKCKATYGYILIGKSNEAICKTCIGEWYINGTSSEKAKIRKIYDIEDLIPEWLAKVL